jgi:hypothetical protein
LPVYFHSLKLTNTKSGADAPDYLSLYIPDNTNRKTNSTQQ